MERRLTDDVGGDNDQTRQGVQTQVGCTDDNKRVKKKRRKCVVRFGQPAGLVGCDAVAGLGLLQKIDVGKVGGGVAASLGSSLLPLLSLCGNLFVIYGNLFIEAVERTDGYAS
eukprot:775682-Prorocentrum_minimum.AAC.1